MNTDNSPDEGKLNDASYANLLKEIEALFSSSTSFNKDLKRIKRMLKWIEANVSKRIFEANAGLDSGDFFLHLRAGMTFPNLLHSTQTAVYIAIGCLIFSLLAGRFSRWVNDD